MGIEPKEPKLSPQELGEVFFPEDFVELMRSHLGPEQAEQLFAGLHAELEVSVRLNPAKVTTLQDCHIPVPLGEDRVGWQAVPWCPSAFYLPSRPTFTFDPLFHAGVYYVQEASSMYLDEVLRRYLPEGDIAALDLCAAPGGKSTLIRSRLTSNSLLISNEPMRQRAQVLAENMIKWGHPNSVVTQNFPDEFRHLTDTFQLVVADVPCSGEGMFRKDETAIREWSLQNVDTCWRRQRQIVEAIWPTLQAGGLFVYSTCTFNRFEDEDNVQWIAHTLGADVLEQRHFFPGRDRGEGFFIAALRKNPAASELKTFETFRVSEILDSSTLLRKLHRTLRVLFDGTEAANQPMSSFDEKPKKHPKPNSPLLGRGGGGEAVPPHALAMSTAYERGTYPEVELSYADAVAYLRREALHIAAPRGIVLVTYRSVPLGFAKSVGSRLNNLYPQEWRIRTTYTTPFTLLEPMS